MTWQSVALTVLSVLFLALYYPLAGLAYVLWGIFSLLHLLATPFMKLGLGALNLALWPLRFLARYETPFLYLATAVLIGAISGLVMYCTCTILVDYLPGYLLGSLRAPLSPKGKASEQNRKPKDKLEGQKSLNTFSKKDPISPSAHSARLGVRKDTAPLSWTILEEEESSQGSGGEPFEYGYQEEERDIRGSQ